MRSSTSSSKRPVGWGASATLLAAAAGVLLFLDLTCRYGLPRASRIEGRIARERAEASASRPGTDRPTVLLLGNSLLAEGVRFAQLRESLADVADVRRLVVEATTAADWNFGLRRLAGQGARADVAAVVLSPPQISSRAVRGGYSAYHLIRADDLWRAASEAGLSNSATADLIFSHYGAYFGTRAEVRKFVANLLFPDLSILAAKLNAPHRPEPLDAASVEQRLSELRDAAAEAGARLLLIVPPSGAGPDDRRGDVIRNAAGRAGVDVLVPVPLGRLDKTFYADGHHLNAKGASIFTEALVRDLRAQLAPAPQ